MSENNNENMPLTLKKIKQKMYVNDFYGENLTSLLRSLPWFASERKLINWKITNTEIWFTDPNTLTVPNFPSGYSEAVKWFTDLKNLKGASEIYTIPWESDINKLAKEKDLICDWVNSTITVDDNEVYNILNVETRFSERDKPFNEPPLYPLKSKPISINSGIGYEYNTNWGGKYLYYAVELEYYLNINDLNNHKLTNVEKKYTSNDEIKVENSIIDDTTYTYDLIDGATKFNELLNYAKKSKNLTDWWKGSNILNWEIKSANMILVPKTNSNPIINYDISWESHSHMEKIIRREDFEAIKFEIAVRKTKENYNYNDLYLYYKTKSGIEKQKLFSTTQTARHINDYAKLEFSLSTIETQSLDT